MKSISIYAITRKQNIECLQKLERQLSGRTYFLKMREWELESMKALVRELEVHMQDVHALRFFYSFQVPRLGKEFDLLQIKNDQIVNIELKSGKVSDEAVRKQLLQNRYYLSVQGKMIQSYTYISSQERLVRLNNHDHIVEADWDQLCLALQRQSKDYEGDIEDLFQAEMYLFSPVTEPERFLNKEYFLTSQQKDIERRILDKIRKVKYGYFWFSGLPGTGKTLLLYDIAMKLSVHQKVCMIHCGETGKEWKILHDRLLRIAFLSDSRLEECPDFKEYSAILVDEAHLLTEEKLHVILELSEKHPVIFSGDDEDMISDEEMDRTMLREIEHLPDIQSFHLTNRIRTNAELSSFIQNMMHLPEKRMVRYYPHIQVVYANDEEEAEILLKGYQDQLVFIIDERYYYDEKGYLREQRQKQQKPTAVRMLFHRLNEAREEFAIIVKRNEAVYEVLLELLQFSKKETVKTIAE
jgi:DNA replication protein DnaC